MKFHNHIWNHHETYIEISTNMPGIGSVILRNVRKQTQLLSKTNAMVAMHKVVDQNINTFNMLKDTADY